MNDALQSAIQSAYKKGLIKDEQFVNGRQVWFKPKTELVNGRYQTTRDNSPFFFVRYIDENNAVIRGMDYREINVNINEITSSFM